jgi:subtilisin family serine protease
MRLSIRLAVVGALALALGCRTDQSTASYAPTMARSTADQTIGINVLLRGPATATQLAELATFGNVTGRIVELNALFMRARESALPNLQALPYVLAANPDAERQGSPVDAVAATNFTNGLNTWDLDAVNVTDLIPGPDRTMSRTGDGVYIGVLDTGLLDSWRQYFPQERIAEQFAKAFAGQSENSNAEPTNQWEHDQNSHGTHVTSTILGYSFLGTPINGVAPRATVIPVKVLGQNGSGWSSMIARGIVYIADLKAGPLASHPVVINMSLSGGRLDAVEKAAVDYAIARGVIIVAAAGNAGNAGMGFPGAYAPVISAAASGWVGEWSPPGNAGWWFNQSVPEVTATYADNFYIAGFSSRARTGQDLDVAAPGTWVVGPFQLNSGKVNYFFLGGTSMASPHVAGIAALMAEKNGSLTGPQVEAILEATAIALPPGCRTVRGPSGATSSICWAANATGSGLATADAAIAGTPAP